MRGPRVVERQQSHCKETDWPFCSDDDWVSGGGMSRASFLVAQRAAGSPWGSWKPFPVGDNLRGT